MGGEVGLVGDDGWFFTKDLSGRRINECAHLYERSSTHKQD